MIHILFDTTVGTQIYILFHTMYLSLIELKPRTCECRDLKEISGELVGWKDPSPNQQARYFFQISARTLFLALSHTFHCFQTHLVGYISKL